MPKNIRATRAWRTQSFVPRLALMSGWSAMHIAALPSTISAFRFGPAVFPVTVSRSWRKSSARRERKSPYRERISKEFTKSIDDDRARALASALLRIAVIPRG
jgi:hypothetical protein